MSGVGITGKIVPLNDAPFPVFEDINGQGGWRSVADTTARDAIPALFRKIGMVVVDESTGIAYQLVGGILNANWVVQSESGAAFIIRNDLADLAARDSASLPNGCTAYVISEQENYRLDTTNTFAVSSPLVVARGAGAGRWFRKSKAYVVGNFTLWCQSYNYGVAGFTAGQLTATSANNPDILLDMRSVITGFDTQQGVITDLLGNLWLIINNSATSISLTQYAVKDCLASGVPTPVVTHTVPLLAATSEAGGAAFDPENRLWVMNGDHGAHGISSMTLYGARALSAGSGAPGLTISSDPSPGFTPNQQDLVFDGQGNLWCTTAGSNDGTTQFNGGVFMFKPGKQQAGGTQVPDVFWSGTNFDGVALGATSLMAVSPSGLLWVSDPPDNKLRAWNMTAASGNPAPAVVLTCTLFNEPYGIAFDSAGDLWVTSGLSPTILMRIPAAQLTASGAVTPDIVLSPTDPNVSLNKITFPNNPDRVGLLPSGSPVAS